MREVRPRTPVRPAVRLRPAPPLDPPFDDEFPMSGLARELGGQLTLNLPTRSSGRGRRPVPLAPPAGPGRTEGLPGRSGPERAGGEGATTATPLPPEALALASPEAKRAARRFAATCLEIVNGYRPVAQIRPLTKPAHATEIIERLTSGTARLVAQRRTPGRARELVRLRLVRACEPRTGVVEAAASIGTDRRSWALAFRLEHRQGRWLGTTLDLL
ncbi:Rv3235 family protein [Micromonospora sp. NPDC049559]|uniref:Rv3235 family protein n=1 Tax=Micromonospora sp. NPDC049559 TaxID=3155923 RepID=UPI0034204D84